MSALQCLLLIFALIILVPTADHFLRRWDYERQISGKRPERKAKKNMRLPEEKGPFNMDMEVDAVTYETRIKQDRNWRR